MTGHQTTVEAEPRVAEYLRSLDAALTRLPRDDAVELRQQIVEHLNDSISPDADDAQINAVLQRLGTPTDLVADSLESRPRRRWQTVRNWRWQRWVTLAIVVAALGCGTGYVVDMATQPALQTYDTTSGWYYAVDGNSAHSQDNATGNETIIGQRVGHVQGFVFIVHNTSTWPETILGPDGHDVGLGNNFQAPVAVALGTSNADLDFEYRADHYLRTPAVIPPGQSRWLRVTWKQLRCQQVSPGVTDSENVFGLRVKIGWFTHDQTLPLPQTFATTTVAQPNCPTN
jgi:hypothetical protein